MNIIDTINKCEDGFFLKNNIEICQSTKEIPLCICAMIDPNDRISFKLMFNEKQLIKIGLNEYELNAILLHEIAHLNLKHFNTKPPNYLFEIFSILFAMFIFLRFFSNMTIFNYLGLGSFITIIAIILKEQHQNRIKELQADSQVHNSKFSNHLSSALEKIAAYHKTHHPIDYFFHHYLNLFSSHPIYTKRIKS